MRRILAGAVALVAACAPFGTTTVPGASGEVDGGSAPVSMDAAAVSDASVVGVSCSALQPAPDFCDDFEDGAVGARWDEADPRPSSIKLTHEAAPLGGTGNALHVVVENPVESLPTFTGALEHEIDTDRLDGATKIQLDVRLLLGRKESFHFARLAGLVFANANAYDSYCLQLFGVNGTVLDGDKVSPRPRLTAAELGRWYDVRFVLERADVNQPRFRLRTTVDGVIVDERAELPVASGALRVAIGIFETSTGSGAELLDVWFDDVVLRISRE